jgi:hypothetical protein
LKLKKGIGFEIGPISQFGQSRIRRSPFWVHR